MEGVLGVDGGTPEQIWAETSLDGRREAARVKAFVLWWGAYWFRPGRPYRGGMPRMIRWPRKKSGQKLAANEELALAA